MTEPERRTHSIRLSDGSSVDVSEKTAWGILQLHKLIDHMALAQTQAFVLIEACKGSKPQTLVFTNDGDRLDEVGAALHDMGVRVHKLGSVWQGNAPSSNRSLTKN